MLLIYPDTNALFGDPLLHFRGKKLLDVLVPGLVEVRLSPVVLGELKRQVREQAEKTKNELPRVIRKTLAGHTVDYKIFNPLVAEAQRLLDAESGQVLQTLLEKDTCTLCHWPEVDAEELTRRELERRKPSLESGNQSVGLRDTLIWHGLLEILGNLEPDDRVVFVSKDKGFIDGEFLHDELIDEIYEEGLEAESVEVALSLPEAIVHANRFLNRISQREADIRETVTRFLRDLVGEDWLRVAPRSSGFTTYGIEDATIQDVDNIEVLEVEDSRPSTCSARADFVLEGVMHAFTYENDFNFGLDLTMGDIEDGMVWVRFTETVILSARVEYESDLSGMHVGEYELGI